MVTDVANLQREVVAEDVLHTQVIVDDVGILEVRVYRPNVTRLYGRAGDRSSGRENSTRAIPVQTTTRYFEAANGEVAAKGRRSRHLRASLPHRYWRIACAGRDGCQACASWDVL